MNNPNVEMPDYKKLPAYVAHSDGNQTDEFVIITGEGETLTIKKETDTIKVNDVEYYNKSWVDAKVAELEGKIQQNTSNIASNTSSISSLSSRVSSLEGRVS